MNSELPPIMTMPVGSEESGVIRAFADGRVVASWRPVSFLATDWMNGSELLKEEAGSVVACWSGSVDDEEGVFTPSVRTWGPAGQAEFEKAAMRLEKGDQQRATVWLRTHARHVLCDSVRCERVFSRHATERLKLLADPAAMFTRQMVEKVEDHLHRTMESFARQWSSTNQIAAVVLTGLEDPTGGAADPMQTDMGEPMRAVGLSRGVDRGVRGGVDGGLVVRAFVESFGGLEKRVPVVLLDDAPAEQVKMLMEAGWRVLESPV